MESFLQQLINGISLGSIYALVALGYTMVYGVLRLINFAHGDVYMLGAFMGYYISRWLQGAIPQPAAGRRRRDAAVHGWPAPLVGIVMERFAYRPVRKASRLTLLIIAIGVSLLLENGGQLLFGADPKFFPQLIPRPISPCGGR